LPKPNLLQVVDRVLKAKANKLISLASELNQPGRFTRPEDFEIFDELYGDRPLEPGSEENSILVSMRRLMEPGTEDAGPVIDGSDPDAEGTLPDDEELRKEERQNLNLMMIQQFARINPKSIDGEGESEGSIHSRHGLDSLMAPHDRSGPIMLMQRWEDSNMRQVLRITEMLTKMKNGKLGRVDDEKWR
jgi:hypothetical protein